MTTQNRESGFTLVELAIVLVIIGLIVGGVLVGQDLIKAAEIRTVISDVEKFNAAANTFRTKFDGYPGDIPAARASQAGFQSDPDATALNGNGNGRIENITGTVAEIANPGGETTLFWRHLTQAGLIQQAFNMATGDDTVAIAIDEMVDYFPSTRLRENTYFHIHSGGGRNFYHMSSFETITATTGVVSAESPGFTNLEASDIDNKIDDGQPLSGSVQAVTAINTLDFGNAVGTGECVFEGTTPAAVIDGDETYILDDPTGVGTEIQSEPNCSLRVRASF